MVVTELDTFVSKFYQLWKSGLTAHLDLDTRAGNAWVGLRVQLGQAPGPQHVQPVHQPFHRKAESPSRQRRRARRAAARTQDIINVEESDKVAGEAKIVDNEEESNDIVVEANTEVGVLVAEDAIKELSVETVAVEKATKTEDNASEDLSADKAMKDPTDAGETKTEGDPDPIEEKLEFDLADSVEVVDELCSDAAYNVRQPQLPVKVEVSATAVFENSRNARLTKEEIDSLEAVLLGKSHLKENILKLKEGQETNRTIKQGLFKHTLDLTIIVNTEKLWESARTYIWRNLGQNEWKKPNGAKLSIVRIHVKN